MKKPLLVFTVILCLTAVLAGCAGATTPKKPDASLTEESGVSGEQPRILIIEAEDPLHLDFGAFRVGDTFTTYEKTDERGEVGVTVRVHQSSIDIPYLAYFTCAPEMKDLTVDTSGCKLDENGCFTEPGVFTVKLGYKGFETTYDIRVEEAGKE